MRRTTAVVVITGAVALLGLTFSPRSAIGSDPEEWRYVFHRGQWWYWLPENRWVYWRGNRWNDYYPPAPAAGRGTSVARGDRARAATGDRGAEPSDIRPFYGHALSGIDTRAPSAEEIGPFYGHALPQEVFGPWRSRRARIGPFYGHADSSYGY